MAISPMKKVTILAHQEIQEDLIRRLQEMEMLQISSFKLDPEAVEDSTLSKNGEVTDERLEARHSDIQSAINYLSKFKENRGLISGILPSKIILSPEQYQQIVDNFEEAPVIQQIRGLEREKSDVLSEISRVESLMDQLRPWINLDAPLEDLSPTDHTTILLGLLPSKILPELRKKALSLTEAFEVETVHEGKEGTYLVVTFHSAFQEPLLDLLKNLGFEEIKFHDLKGTPRELYQWYLSRIRELRQMIQTIDEKSGELIHHRQNLQILYDHLTDQLQQKRAESFFGQTAETFIIEGWIPSTKLAKFRDRLNEEFKELALFEVEPKDGETPPIYLENPKSIRPFEVITELYGMPNSREFDPSPFLAPFFFIFFGLCLTDAAYGIILTIAFLFFLRKYRVTLGRIKLMWVLLFGGISAIFMGAITGGWFGDLVDYLPSSLYFLKEGRDALMLFNPMDQVMIFIFIALILGFIQVCFGLVIRIVRNIRDRDWVEALCSPLAWLILINSIVLILLGHRDILPPFLKTIGMAMVGLSGLTILLFTDRTTPNRIIRVAWGIYELYGITSYLGDVLSYLRLFALGLATAIIAMVVNLLGNMVLGLPYVGWAIFIPIFIIGHLFNIAINGLGAFVHTLRLQYVEFFPKFFQGGGRPFRPFKKNPKYSIVADGL
ncbi:MAG: V-type ATP synthase subunit I [Syntrophobacterales bacterium]|nr:MAG: V-type ATP synthase subunit I [Syntrophobacterales bacterium]